LYNLFKNVGGLGDSLKYSIIKRFEFNYFQLIKKKNFLSYPKEFLRALNIFFSQISTINNQAIEIKRLTLLRLYLIKSYKGKSHAIGKPVRGQRT